MADNATATDLSLLHLAVLDRSVSEVQRLLSTKRYTASYPTPALTTMECALGWPEGLHLLAAAGAVPTPAIELALFRHDVDSVAEILSTEAPMFLDTELFAESQRRHPWSSSRRSNELCSSALQASLCLHCYYAGDSICSLTESRKRLCCADRADLKRALSPSRDETHRLLVIAVKERRAMLAKLAMEYLPLQKCRELGVSSDSPLDSTAFATYTTLLESGISVPGALYPGKRPLLLSFNILCRSGGFPLTQALFDNGVCELNVSVNGVSPLASIFEEDLASGQKELAIRWLLENGARATFHSSDMLPNLLFYLASVYDSAEIHDKYLRLNAQKMMDSNKANLIEKPSEFSLAYPERKTTPTMIGLVAQYCNPVERDSCSCPCSSGGCLPLHKFRIDSTSGKPHVWPRRLYCWLAEYWPSFSAILRSWIRDCQLDGTQAREYLRDACRLEVHTRLGMAHTCCIFRRDRHHGRVPRRQERDKELCQELEDEDTELAEQLEDIMEEYDTALSEHQGTTEEFWTRWWEDLQSHLPEVSAEERKRRFWDRARAFHHGLAFGDGWDL